MGNGEGLSAMDGAELAVFLINELADRGWDVVPAAAVDTLRELVRLSDGGADTYEVGHLVESARQTLGLPSRFAREHA